MSKTGRSSLYKTERAKYKALFPKVKTHHLFPHERTSDDTEFNLFPWNATSHSAWHLLFANLRTSEVWGILEPAWELIWHSGATRLKPLWRWQYRFIFKEEDQQEFDNRREICRWQSWWINTFGDSTPEAAQYLLRCMMLSMAFGHKAYTDEVTNTARLATLVSAIPAGGEREWAFVTCFGKPLDTQSIATIKRQIRCVLENTEHARPYRAPTARP